MNDLLLYFLKSGIAMSLFYLIYWLFMQNETLYSVNRFYLIGTLVLSLVIPIIPFENLFIVKERLAVPTFMIDMEGTDISAYSMGTEDNGFRISVLSVFQLIYLSGVFILIGGLIFEVIRLVFMRGEHKQYFGSMKIIFVNKEIIPFSWFNLMFMDNSSRQNPQINTIIQHEYAHFRNLHFIDLLIIEMITVFQWFNPLVWLYLRSIREIHEYQADAAVLTKTQDTGSYQALLVNQLTGAEVFRLGNAFSKSLTKKRMIMMKRMKSKRSAWLKTLTAVPVLAFLMIVFAGSPAEIVSGDPVTIRGKVIEADSKTPIPGVHVVINGGTIGTATDNEGYFTIEAPDKKGKLVFSFVGYKSIITELSIKQPLIELERSSMKLDPYTAVERDVKKVNDTGQKSESKEIENTLAEDEAEVFYIVESIAHYPGGLFALKEYLSENIIYPVDATEAISTIMVRFTIERKGEVENIIVTESFSKAMDGEAYRLVSEMQDWEPATQRGKPVRSDYILPVQFLKKF
jgi:hypothetical protein